MSGRLGMFLTPGRQRQLIREAIARLPADEQAELRRQERAWASKKGWARRKRQWDDYLLMHGSHERLFAFTSVASEMDDTDYWRLLSDVWIHAEGNSSQPEVWRYLLTADRPGREALMTPHERAKLAALPDPLTIYRGYDREGGENGLSWTPDRDMAEWFAQRFASDGAYVATGTVCHADVLAFWLRRGGDEPHEPATEREILTLPESVTITGTERTA